MVTESGHIQPFSACPGVVIVRRAQTDVDMGLRTIYSARGPLLILTPEGKPQHATVVRWIQECRRDSGAYSSLRAPSRLHHSYRKLPVVWEQGTVTWRLVLLQPRVGPGAVAIGIHRTLKVAVDIEGENVPPGVACVRFKKKYLRLTGGLADVKLPAGTFRQLVSWSLEAVEEVEETWVQISVGQRFQIAEFPVRISKLKQVK